MYPHRPAIAPDPVGRYARRALSQLYSARGVPRWGGRQTLQDAWETRDGWPSIPRVVVVSLNFYRAITGPEGARGQKKLEELGNSGYSLPTSHQLIVSPRARGLCGSVSVFPDDRTGSLCCTAQDGTAPE